MRKTFVIVVGAVLFAALTAQAGIVYPIGQASTAGFSNGGYVGPSPRGWDFTITQSITVLQLGVNAGVDVPITLSLWDVTTQTLLTQTVATSSAFSWVFADITPLTLSVGDTYSVIGWADTNNTGLPWYIFNNAPPAAFNPVGVVNYQGVRFDNGIDANTFPMGTLAPPAQYGVTDIGYESTVPEPGTIALLGSGILGFAGVLRRKLMS